MNRLLIGSSNVSMTYYPEKFKGYPPFKMIKCTKIEVFKALMEEIKEEKEVIIAVIENFLCDAVRGIQNQTSELIDESMESTIGEFIGVIGTTATRLPDTRFALAQPIMRPRHDWYTEKYDGLCRSFVARINSLGLDNVSKMDAMPRTAQAFVEDQVHLTKESSAAYVNGMLYNAEALFTAEVVDLEEGTSKKPERLIEKVTKGKLEAEFERSVRNLDKKLMEINQGIFRRRFNDSLVMARMREDIDTISNSNKENKMVISGMTSRIPKPTGREESKNG